MCDVILVTLFGDVMMMTSLNDVITDVFEVRFLYTQLKNPQLGQIT